MSSPNHSPTHSPSYVPLPVPYSPVHRKHTPVSETDGVGELLPMSYESVGKGRESGGPEVQGSAVPSPLSLEQLQPTAIKGKLKKLKGSVMKSFSDG